MLPWRPRSAAGWWLAGLLAIGLLLVASASILHLRPVRDRVLAWTQATLRRTVDLDLRASALDYNLFTLSATLRDVRLAALSHQDDPFFTADRVDVDPPWSILRNPWALGSIVVERPTVSIHRASDGSWNLPRGRGGPPRSPAPLLIDRLVVRELSLGLADAPTIALDAAGVTIDLAPESPVETGQPPPRLVGSLRAARGLRIERAGRSTVASELQAALAFDGTDVAFSPLHVALPEGTVDFNGRLGPILASPSLDGTFTGTIDLERTAPWIPSSPPIAGTARVEGRVSGPASSPAFEVEATAPRMTYAALDIADLTANARWADDTLTVARARGRTAGGTFDASGAFAAGEAAPSSLDATWKGMRVNDLVVGLGEPPPARLLATASGSARLRWRVFTPRDLEITIVNDLTSAEGNEAGLPANGHLEVRSQRGRWNLAQSHVVGATTIDGPVELGATVDRFGDMPLTGRLAITAPAIDRTLTDLRQSGLIDAASAWSTMFRGSASVDAVVSGTLASPSITGPLVVEHAAMDTFFSRGSLQSALAVDAHALDLRDLTFRVGDNLTTGGVQVDFSRRTIDGAFHSRATDLAAFDGSALARVRATGALEVDTFVDGTFDTPRVSARLAAANLGVAGQPPLSGSATVRFERGRLEADELEARQPSGGEFSGRGWFEPVTGALALDLSATSVTVSPIELYASGTDEPSTIPVTTVVTGQLNLTGSVSQATGRGEIHWTRLDAWEGTFGTGGATLTADAGTIAVSANIPSLNLVVDGTVESAPPRALTVNARARGVSLAALADVWRSQWPPDLTMVGSASIDARVEGQADDLANAVYSADLVALDGTANGVGLSLTRGGTVRYDARGLSVDAIDVRIGESTIALSGTLARGASSPLEARIEGSLADLNPFLVLVPALESLAVRGSMSASVRASGTVDRPTLEGAVSVRGGTASWRDLPPVEGIELAATLENGSLQVREARARWLDAAAGGTATLPLRLAEGRLPASLRSTLPDAPREASLSAVVTNLTPRALEPFLAADTLAQLSGVVDAAVDLRGDALDPARLAGTLRLDRATLSAAGIAVAQTAPSTFAIERGQLAVRNWNLKGDTTDVIVDGTASLQSPYEVALTTRGVLDLAVLRPFVGFDPGGYLTTDLRADGPASAMRLAGQAYVTNGLMLVRDPRLAVSDITATIALAGDRAVLSDGYGWANGGLVAFSGDVAFPDMAIDRARFVLSGSQVGLELPRGLRSELAPAITFEIADGVPLISGRVEVTGGVYRDPLNLTTELLTNLGQISRASTGESSLLSRTRLDVAVVTTQDLLVDNNYGRLELASDLLVVGTIARPALAGRLTMREGGEIYLGGNTYHIESGTIDFTNRTRIEPSVAITARTKVRAYDITLNVTGTPGTIRTTLTADPSLGENQIIALLVTGDENAQSLTGGLRGTEVLGYLSGELSGLLNRAVGLRGLRVERGLGSTASDFDLVSNDIEPTTRLTLTRRLGEYFDVILSQDLRESGKLSWIAIFHPYPQVDLRVASRDDGTRSAEIRQDITFGGTRDARSRRADAPAPLVARIAITGEPGFDVAALRERLETREGRPFEFFRWQRDRDRLQEYYTERGYLEARITAMRQPADAASLALEFRIRRGPKSELTVEGVDVDGRTRDQLRTVWTQSLSDGFLTEDLAQTLRTTLARRGYVRARVDAQVVARTPESKQVRIEVDPGAVSTSSGVTFAGNEVVGSDRLEALVREEQLELAPWLDPGQLADRLEAFYADQGYLDASASVDEPTFDNGAAHVTVRIREGRQYTVGAVVVEGARARSEADVRSEFAVVPGAAFAPSPLEEGRQAVDAAYRRLGYNDVRENVTVDIDREKAAVLVTLSVDEGPQQVLAAIDVAGNRATRLGTVLSTLDLTPGQPVDLAAWDEARRRLYDLGTFRSVDILPAPREPADAPATEGQQPTIARVSLEEWPLYRFRYGFQTSSTPVDDVREIQSALLAEISRRNLFGAAIDTGAALRYQRDRQVGRIYVSAPRLFGRALRTSLFGTQSRETLPTASDLAPEFVTDKTGVTVEQRLQPARLLEVVYSYRYERNHTFQRDATDDSFDLTVDVARFNSALVLDTRDSFANATQGLFHSSSVEVAGSSLGSDVAFVKYLGQQFVYPRVGPFVLASALRVGLARPMGNTDELIPSERFFVGGGNTVRGYADDSLGPSDFFGPNGGNALLVLNGEARFPIAGWLKGVGFIDAGNVFARVGDVSLSDLKVGLGAGLRFDTPFALVRIDYGVPMNADDRRRRGRWYFSLGQAF